MQKSGGGESPVWRQPFRSNIAECQMADRFKNTSIYFRRERKILEGRRTETMNEWRIALHLDRLIDHVTTSPLVEMVRTFSFKKAVVWKCPGVFFKLHEWIYRILIKIILIHDHRLWKLVTFVLIVTIMSLTNNYRFDITPVVYCLCYSNSGIAILLMVDLAWKYFISQLFPDYLDFRIVSGG